MKNIIEWLISAEARTLSVYNKAADYFPADEEFSTFIRQLAHDEKEHHTVITQVYSSLESVLPLTTFLEIESGARFIKNCRTNLEFPFTDSSWIITRGSYGIWAMRKLFEMMKQATSRSFAIREGTHHCTDYCSPASILWDTNSGGRSPAEMCTARRASSEFTR